MSADTYAYLVHTEQRLLAGDAANALRYARMGLALEPDSAALWELSACAAARLGDDDFAMHCWLRVIELRPHSALAYNDLAVVVERLGRASDAETLYRTALRFDPGYATAASNLGVLLTSQGRDGEAELWLNRALTLRPNYPRARLNLAQLLLRQGRYAEGWPLHEGRLRVASTHQAGGAASAGGACREWAGESLGGKSILVIPEQGYGDEIQFCRYLAWLKKQGAARLTQACWPGQQTLMQSLAGPDAVIAVGELGNQIATHDYWTFLLSLPLYARTDADNIPATIPYLHADPRRVAATGAILGGEGLRVGIVWRGNPQHENDSDRSLPSLEVLAPLWQCKPARFFSLQKSPAAPWPLPTGLPIVDLAPHIRDWADSAALLSQLDLLISVDSAVAHLAGALGIPCWILLPAFRTDWRWQRARDDSPWYPSVRLFRQTQRGEWHSVANRLAAALADFADKSLAPLD